jgi:hypothetical protein
MITYTDKNGYEAWRKHSDKWLCHRCYCKFVLDPKWRKINNSRKVTFKGKQITVKENPRKGVCSNCGAVKDTNCKMTAMHHLEYDESDPLAHTIELCGSCHGKESARLGQLTGRQRIIAYRQCSSCGSFITYFNQKTGSYYWSQDKLQGYLCYRCYSEKRRAIFLYS